MKKGTAAIIENFDGAFLLHLRDEHAPTMKNQWCLVGGTVDSIESVEDATVREVKEETGLDIHDLEFFKKFVENNKEEYIYHGKVDTRKQKLRLGEGRKLEFFSKGDLKDLIGSLDYTNSYLEAVMEFIQVRFNP